MVGDGGQLRLRPVLFHVRVVGDRILALLFRRLHHGRRVRVVGDHVGALADQGDGRVAFLARVKPAIDPYHFDFRLGIDAAHAAREGVDSLQHFRDGKRRHVAGHMGLAHLACQHAGQVAALVETGIRVGHVGRRLVARQMNELHVRKLLRHFQGGIHVAERGRDHQLAARLRQVADHALGIGALRHVFHKLGGDLVAQRLFHFLARLIVLGGPACVADGADIHEADVQRNGGRCGGHGRHDGHQNNTADGGAQ